LAIEPAESNGTITMLAMIVGGLAVAVVGLFAFGTFDSRVAATPATDNSMFRPRPQRRPLPLLLRQKLRQRQSLRKLRQQPNLRRRPSRTKRLAFQPSPFPIWNGGGFYARRMRRQFETTRQTAQPIAISARAASARIHQ